MGCDIYLFVEVEHDGNWNSVDEWETEDGYKSVAYEKQYYNGRNYDLFALLANVRNYNDVKPIKCPVGLPDDVSDQVMQKSESYGSDGHSHSYLTLKELIDFDWDQSIKEAGYMNNEQWDKFNKSLHTDNPDYDLRYSYCQGIGPTLKDTHTWHEWNIPVKIAVSDFFDKTLPKLVELDEPDKVRIVFFFDN